MKRILLDENLPRLLKRSFPGFEVWTVSEAGWAGIKNGQLLRLAEVEFDVFVTADKNLPHQQPLPTFDLSIVVLRSPTTKLEDLHPLVPSLLEILCQVQVGNLYYVGAV